ncbi:integrase core domain-containing protein [Streptomyces viridosporus]|uniref:integrase core domain-containing protein n=1 Tax=Streptomyces viridosporus TaxID=67581 RepID=UPI0037018BC9
MSRRAWAPQQARRLLWHPGGRAGGSTHLIRDRDTQLTAALDAVFSSEGITVARIPPGSPDRHPHAEPFVRSAREERTDRLLLFGRGHAEQVLHDYARHFNHHRPHRGRRQLAAFDDPNVLPPPTTRTRRRRAVAGLLNAYHPASRPPDEPPAHRQ